MKKQWKMVAAVAVAWGLSATAAEWQDEIDAAAAMGGGRVTIPAGRHVTGGLMLKSNVELHLEKGAVLEGSPTTNDYPVVELPCSEGKWMAVVMAVGATNVAITGEGEIYGNGTAFPQPESYGRLQEGWRPRGLFFGNCRGVTLKGFRLRDSGCWGCVVQCCEDVEIRGLTIDNHANANNDGIDIEAFNAVIADCDIDASDDGVCLKSNNPEFRSGNILVTNVTARSHCAALKIGTASHGIVTNVLFVDCRLEAPRRSFPDRRKSAKKKPAGASWFWSEWRAGIFPPSKPGDDLSASAISIECVDGGWVEDITCRNITIDGTLAPLFVRGGTRQKRATGAPPGKWHILRNVLFENIRGRSLSWYGNSVTGVEGCRVENVTLRNVHLTFPGGGEAAKKAVKAIPEMPGAGPGTCMFDTTLPASALWARHVDGLVLDDVTIEPEYGTFDAREPYVLEDVTGCRVVEPKREARSAPWTKAEAWAWYGRQPWIRGCNYMPASCANRVDQWQAYGADERFAEMEEELALMQATGFNAVRIILGDQGLSVWCAEHDGMMERFERMLAAFEQHGVRAIVVLGNDCSRPKELWSMIPPGPQKWDVGYHGGRKLSQHGSFPDAKGYIAADDPVYGPKFWTMCEEFLTKYARDRRILFWNLWNEPGNNGRCEVSVPNIRRIFELAWRINPDQPLAADVWSWDMGTDPNSKNPAQYLAGQLSDIVSYHSYANYESQVRIIRKLRRHFDRPLVNTEWLARIVGCNVAECYPLFYLEKVGCTMWGFVAGKYQTYEPWESMWREIEKGGGQGYDMTKWFHDLYRPSLRPYDPKETDLIKRFNKLADEDRSSVR